MTDRQSLYNEDPQQYLENSISGACGYCGRSTWFRLRAATWAEVVTYNFTDERHCIAALYQCGGCEKASLYTFQTYTVGGFRHASFLERIPSARALRSDLLPEDIDLDRIEALNSHLAGQNRAAILMARAALQRAVRTLDPFRGDLNKELDNLLANGIITKQLRANADEVRLSGNDVAHPESLGSVTDEEAEDSLTFLDNFLETTITVPERQRRRRDERTQRDAAQ